MRNKQDHWLYVKNILRSYPKIKELQRYLLDTKVTATYGGIGGVAGGKVSSAVETAALKELHPKDQRRLKAIEDTIAETRHMPDGTERLRVVEMVYFKQTHTLLGAAAILGLRKQRAIDYSSTFISAVAEKLDLP